MPLPWYAGEPLELPGIYIAGMWTALVSGLVFSATYVNRIAREARQMSDALTATEIIHAREQQLSALDGLAAAAAHELGTPLATIALVAKELKRELPAEGQVAEDLDLLISQTARCREILSRLADREAQRDEMFASLKLTVMIEEIVAPLRGGDIVFAVSARPFEDADGQGAAEPLIWRNPAIKYGLGNLIENAADFARSRSISRPAGAPADVAVTITDDGPGFSQEVIDRLGEPYVTTRQGYGLDEATSPESQSEGMGLGFFIANRLLERSGATVTLANRPAPDHGAQVRVSWPREAIEDQRRPSSPFTSIDRQAADPGQRAAAVGDRHGNQDLVGARGIVDAHFHAVEMAAHVSRVLVPERNVERLARPAALLRRRHQGAPFSTAARNGAPSLGCSMAAACSSSPFSPTSAALP
jgi:two-component system, sensor histidine kinase RegB